MKVYQVGKETKYLKKKFGFFMDCPRMIYILTAIGFSPGGSKHLHTNNI